MLLLLSCPLVATAVLRGFTISPDGGFDEFDEFFFALLNSSISCATLASSSATRFSSRSQFLQRDRFFLAAMKRLIPNSNRHVKDQFRIRERLRFFT